MSSYVIENGKRIEELLEETALNSSSYTIISINNLTRKINIRNLRRSFCGDNSTNDLNNLYYSCEKINQYMTDINDQFSQISNENFNINNRIDSISNTLGNDLGDLHNYVETIYNELKESDNSIQLDINNKYQLISTNINKLAERTGTLENTVGEIPATSEWGTYNITQRVLQNLRMIIDANTDILNILENLNNITTKLGNINGIKVGTAVPTTLPEGEIYLQYFE